ncbi:MAG: NAD(+) synthetase [Thermofilum sp. ex4484_82]|nr:MAG: NAD(+) synthetase [Thermofilum sp. ex4484_82]OYT38897.1 MAG: NAD(+) synthetase [Archaeoglobales archaeon ex4484_92]
MKITLDDLKIDCGYVERRITDFIKEYFEKTGIGRAVLGLSGGVDSATVAYLTVKALGNSRVKVLIMPDSSVTPSKDIEDAKSLAKLLAVDSYTIDIANIVREYTKTPFYQEEQKVALGNLRARIRMTLLYYYANANNAIVVGTGDKSEILIGYFTKYGDGAVDILPIGDLYKTQVRQLALHLGVPREIALKPSSPALWPGQTAEKELGVSYDEIDLVLYALFDKRIPIQDISNATGVEEEKIKIILERISSSAHKRRMPPIPKVSARTIGLDLRLPQFFKFD